MSFRGVGFPVCQKCSKRMRIVRRGLRFDDYGYFEQQEFICVACNIQSERRVNTSGVVREPHQSGSVLAERAR
jgi:hypothetical protein